MKNKGFTLVELLAAMVILAILIMIGVMTVSNVFDNTKDNYYKSMENTLNIAGNEFFNDNRQEKPIDDYNFVDLATLQEHEYLEELMTYDNKEKCDPKSGVFIFNDNDHTGYEVCLICGDHKSKGDFCNGKKMGVIDVSGNVNEPNGPFYNPLLSYSGTSWINALSIYIHFNLETEGMSVSEYKIYNANTNGYVGSCTGMSGNSCTKSFSTTGSYYVEAYGTQSGVEGSGKIANRKYFNVKIDNTPPTFSLKDTDPIIELEKDNIVEPYENEVIDINDDNGYKEVKYSLEQYKGDNADGTEKYDPVSGHTDVDIKDKDLKIPASLESGKYKLRVTVTDFAGNKGKCNNCTNKETNEIIFYIKYKIDLQYYDKSDKKHDVGNLWIYTYGLYREEDASGNVTKRLPDKIRVNSNPQDVDWYMNANLVGNVVTSYEPQVQKTGYHVLYAREQKMKTGFHATCINPIYNGTYQPLLNIPTEEQGKYRIMVYVDGQLRNNVGRNVNRYMIIAVLNSDYMWNDVPVADAKKSRAIYCNIQPKPIPAPNCNTGLVYNGSSQYLIGDKYGGDSLTTIVDQNETQGLFTSHDIRQEGYTPGEYTPIFSGDTLIGGGFSYGGSNYYSGNTNYNGGEPMYYASPIAAVNAGSYNVTLTMLTNNYIFSENNQRTLTRNGCKIDPMPLTVYFNHMHNDSSEVTKAPSDFTAVYDGNPNTIIPLLNPMDMNSYVSELGPESNVNITLSTLPSKTDVGTYNFTAVCSSVTSNDSGYMNVCSNYTFNGASATLVITPKPIDFGGSSYCKKATYNGRHQAITVSPPEGVRFSYGSSTSVEIFLIAAKYTLKASLVSNNYKWSDNTTASKSFQCELEPAPVTLTWEPNSFVYDGSAHAPSPGATGVSGETIHMRPPTGQTNAGSYTAETECSTVSGGSAMCLNYSFSPLTFDFTIERAKTATTGSCGSGDYTLGSAMVSGGDYVSYSNNTASSTGSKKVTITADSNHLFSDGTETKTKTCTITKVRQKRTKSCSTYTYGSCSSWNSYGSYGSCSYYSDQSNGTTTSCTTCGTQGTKYKCKTRTCASYSVTGCSSWGSYGSWSDVDSCSSGESSDHSTYTDCQDVYRIS